MAGVGTGCAARFSGACALPRPPAALLLCKGRRTPGRQLCRSQCAAGVQLKSSAAVGMTLGHRPPARTVCSAVVGDTGGNAAPSQQFSLLRIAGDGNCLFRSLAQGAHVAVQENAAAAADAGGQAPQLLSAELETAAAVGLRASICQELLTRREELCFFIDGDYDAYVARMLQPHTWGGEPELAVATHVLRRPIAVYMLRHTGLQQISCYGDEQYGSAASVPLLFHGAGHYDLLLREPEAAGPRSRL